MHIPLRTTLPAVAAFIGLLLPEVAYAAAEAGSGQIAAIVVGLLCFFSWWLAIRLVRKGGGWILLGVLVMLGAAVPLSFFALIFGIGLTF